MTRNRPSAASTTIDQAIVYTKEAHSLFIKDLIEESESHSQEALASRELVFDIPGDFYAGSGTLHIGLIRGSVGRCAVRQPGGKYRKTRIHLYERGVKPILAYATLNLLGNNSNRFAQMEIAQTGNAAVTRGCAA